MLGLLLILMILTETHDLATLPDLNESIILEYLKARYIYDNIYTYIGDILLAINPNKMLDIYEKDSHKLYTNSNRSSTPPHVFAIADHAYESLKNNAYKSQCCVISGESGAGKTESAKHFIKHLIYLCMGSSRLELQILQVNPILEAFGNAITLMNDNSSRFGKYIELSFFNNKVVGAQISEYLLEKSRVVSHSNGEQNFHIFYYLIAGLEDSYAQKYYLINKETRKSVKFNYLKQHASLHQYSELKEKIQMKDKFDELINAMNYIAFMEREQTDLFSALIGILHVGNLKFKANDDGYAMFDETGDSKLAMRAVSRLLGVNSAALISAMTASAPTSAGGREEFVRNFTLDAALDTRDAMAKHIYSKVFSWLVLKINKTLMCEKNYGNFIKKIGILDIYGFEHFPKNNFEQLCINLANEQIQYFFNKHIFSLEKEEYGREGINSISITFNDNLPLLDLFMGNTGILKKLDDLCKLPKASNVNLIENFNKDFAKNQHYIPSKRSHEHSFTINHYAGRVTYSSDGFMEKNRDSLPFKIMELLKNSKNKILSEIFTNTANEAIHDSSKSIYNKVKDARTSVSAQYRMSLEFLMKRMSESKPIFLRCIKPNASKRSDDFDDKFVLLQLRYCGVLETTRIRKEGYSLRPTFQEFIERYKYLSPSSDIKFDSTTARQILNNTKLQNWRVGKSKVFLKYYHYDELKSILDQYIAYAIIIQKYIRGWLARKHVLKRTKQCKLEQNKLKDFCTKLNLQCENIYETISKSNTIIQKKEAPAQPRQKITHIRQKSPVSHEQTKDPSYYDRSYPNKNHIYQCIDPPTPLSKITRGYEKYLISPGFKFHQPLDLRSSRRVRIETKVYFQRKVIELFKQQWSSYIYHQFGDLVDHGSINDICQPSIYDNMEDRGSSEQSSRHYTNRQYSDAKRREPSWLYGKITRGQSEKFLNPTEVGTFLIRKSDSREGYSLSFKAENRCRHYMIDALPNGKFIIIGEPKVHRTIKELSEYHRNHKLSNWNGYLSHPYNPDD